MLIRRRLAIQLALLLGVVISSVSAHEIASNVIRIQFATIAVDRNTDAFMRLENKGQSMHEIVAAFTPVARQVQMYKTYEDFNHWDVPKKVPEINLASNQRTTLKLEGLHLGLLGLKKPLMAGETVPLAIIYEDGSWTDVYAKVV